MVCGCCGAVGKTRTGCSCTGGKSHECLKLTRHDEVQKAIRSLCTACKGKDSQFVQNVMNKINSQMDVIMARAKEAEETLPVVDEGGGGTVEEKVKDKGEEDKPKGKYFEGWGYEGIDWFYEEKEEEAAAPASNRLFFQVMGLPGSGKSTAVLNLVRGYANATYDQPIAHVKFAKVHCPRNERGVVTQNIDLIYLGKIREKWPGTDALPNKHDDIFDFLRNLPSNACVISEGQRCTSHKFLQAVVDMDYEIVLYEIKASDENRASRLELAGRDSYSEIFEKRVRGSIRNITDTFFVKMINGNRTPSEVWIELKSDILDHMKETFNVQPEHPETLHNLVIYFKFLFVWGSFGNLRLMSPTPTVIRL